METFIVIQMKLDKEETYNNGDKQFLMSNIVRRIIAENKEQAIGKFVIGTQSIKAQKKLNIECYGLNELKSEI